jgi:triosephosphate isomerase (TIM)
MANNERRRFIAGNWKMNGLKKSNAELFKILEDSIHLPRDVDLVICPPATLITTFAGLLRGSRIKLGAQDCHAEPHGAFTGEIAAEMLADAGASHVIVGHSERRTIFGETDNDVRAKTLGAWRAGLIAIVCIGESRAQRDERETLQVVGNQLNESIPNGARAENLIIAYEPVWSIGTGLTPSSEDIAEVHTFLRRRLGERYGTAGQGIRLIYGGSVRPANAKELLSAENVDGALVGGASLRAEEFLAIAGAYR